MYATNDTHTVFLQIGSPDLVILLACSNQQLRQRLEKRASQQGRPDDNAHAIEKRLDTFKHNITLIAKYYQERGLIVRVRCCSLLIFILTVEFSWFSQHGLFCGWLQMLLCLKNCLVLCWRDHRPGSEIMRWSACWFVHFYLQWVPCYLCSSHLL